MGGKPRNNSEKELKLKQTDNFFAVSKILVQDNRYLTLRD